MPRRTAPSGSTPQIIVNGTTEVVGNQTSAVETRIAGASLMSGQQSAAKRAP
jgi:hypothetical protein